MSGFPPSQQPGSNRLRFDTAGLPAPEALARYRDFFGLGAEVRQTGPDVRVAVEAWRLDRMLFYDRRLNDVGHDRDLPRVQADGFTHFTATLLLDGELEMVGLDGRVQRPRPGEVLLADTHVPNSNRMRGAHLVTLSIARERMAATTDDVAALHGSILTGDEARLFREFVESLLRNLPTMSAHASASAASVLTTLLTVAIDNSGAGRPSAASSRDVERLGRLKRLIDDRLADADFGTAEAVGESGLSRASLYRLVAPEGGLATLIRHRRLESIRARLSDPAQTRTFAELADAAGFANASYASHAFVDRYGIRPSDYRDVVGSQTGADAFFKLRLWQEEVR